MAEFYDHPATGNLHFKAVAGGGSGIYDAPATVADMRAYPAEHQAYLHARHIAHEQAKADAARESAAADAKAALDELTAEKAVLEQQVETLSAAVGKL